MRDQETGEEAVMPLWLGPGWFPQVCSGMVVCPAQSSPQCHGLHVLEEHKMLPPCCSKLV